MTDEVRRHRTAMRRTTLSRPMALALADGFVTSEAAVFDYGCGRGDDLRHLKALGMQCSGWDPAHAPDRPLQEADVVNFGFVVNVIENARERQDALERAWALARSVLVVAARLQDEARGLEGSELGDGLFTRSSTFQKFYTQEELRNWIDGALDVRSVAAAPGVFYVFRDPAQVQLLLSRRHARSTPIPKLGLTTALYESHRELLEELMQFIAVRGRLPRTGEFSSEPAVIEHFGTLKRAFRVIQDVTGDSAWEEAAGRRAEDLLVYLALARFGKRPRFSELPVELQGDVKAHGGSYSAACELADALLFQTGDQERVSAACAAAGVGRLSDDALVVHVSALDELPPLLRTYEGCGRVLTGEVEDATLVRLRRDKPKVDYLRFPTFERDPHPALAGVVSASLRRLSVRMRNMATATDQPILHRKESFLADGHPLKQRFARLTRQEERLGLLSDPFEISTRSGWDGVLRRAGVRLRGHRVERI